MKRFCVPRDVLSEVLHDAMVKAASCVPRDVKEALESCLGAEEPGSLSRESLATTLSNIDVAEREGTFACPDTGFPLYYLRVGNGIQIEGGYATVYDMCARAVAAATEEGCLRKTMVHPLTRHNPGTNVIRSMPHVELRFDSNIDYLEVTAVPKGGGSEIFGTFYRMTTPADGLTGIRKFVLDSAFRAMQFGKSCPPNVVGVGIGGTADLCMKLAKEAAVLRPIGDRHPEQLIADVETELAEDLNALAIGPMGLGGACTVLDVHIEVAATHTAALPVALNAQCSVCRRATARLYDQGAAEWQEHPDWFGREQGDILSPLKRGASADR